MEPSEPLDAFTLTLPIKSTIETLSVQDHVFVAIPYIPIDLLRCVRCGKQTALNTFMSVALNGEDEYELCKSYENYLEILPIHAKPSVVLGTKQDEAVPVK